MEWPAGNKLLLETTMYDLWKRDSADADAEKDHSCYHLKRNYINIYFQYPA